MYATCNKYCHVYNVADNSCACIWLELSIKSLTSSCGLSPFSDMLSLAAQGNCGICSAPLQPCSLIVLLSFVLLEKKFFDTYMNIVNVFINIISIKWPKTTCLHSVWPRQDKGLTQVNSIFSDEHTSWDDQQQFTVLELWIGFCTYHCSFST